MQFRPPPLPPYVVEMLKERAETLLKELERSATTRGRVESLIVPILHKGEVSMDAVAAHMATSRQTLLRRAERGRHDVRKAARRTAPPPRARLSEGQEGVGERGRVSGGLFRPGRVFARLQALDRQEPERSAHRGRTAAERTLKRRVHAQGLRLSSLPSPDAGARIRPASRAQRPGTDVCPDFPDACQDCRTCAIGSRCGTRLRARAPATTIAHTSSRLQMTLPSGPCVPPVR